MTACVTVWLGVTVRACVSDCMCDCVGESGVSVTMCLIVFINMCDTV